MDQDKFLRLKAILELLKVEFAKEVGQKYFQRQIDLILKDQDFEG